MNFKHCNQNKLVLFPYSFEDLIPKNHPVRVVNGILEKLNIEPLLKGKAYSDRLEYKKNDGNIEIENYFLFLSDTNYPVF